MKYDDLMSRIIARFEAVVEEEMGKEKNAEYKERYFSDDLKANDASNIDSLKGDLLEEVRMFGGTALSHTFEKDFGLRDMLSVKYNLSLTNEDKGLRKHNCYTIMSKKDGAFIGYYGSQDSLETALMAFNLIGGDKSLSDICGLDTHPDYFVLTKTTLFIFECKHIAKIRKVVKEDKLSLYKTSASQYLRQAGVCASFKWFYKNCLAPRINREICYIALLSESFYENEIALSYLDDRDIPYYIKNIKPFSLSEIKL